MATFYAADGSISCGGVVASHKPIVAADESPNLMQAARWAAKSVSLIAIEMLKMQNDPLRVFQIAGERM